MISLAEARGKLMALAVPKMAETLPISACIGRYLAQDVIAKRNQPSSNLSAMDGYAICWSDTLGPWQNIGESAAGRPFTGELAAGQAVRVFTGATIPAGADTVLVQEDVSVEGKNISLTVKDPVQKGAHIRLKSNDFATDQIVLNEGDRLTAGRVALAAMAGYGALLVTRQPKIAYFSTGDELVAPGAPTNDAQLPSSNNPMIAALVSQSSCTFDDMGIIQDDLNKIRDIYLTLASSNVDVIVTSGGVSVGDHDLIQPALRAAGATIEFWKIAMKPGKPVLVARLGQSIILGLPGNPSSAYVTAFLLLLPLIAHLNGANQCVADAFTAVLANDILATGARAEFLRARVSGNNIHAFGRQDSGLVSVLAHANALIIRPAHAEPAAAGDLVSAYLLP